MSACALIYNKLFQVLTNILGAGDLTNVKSSSFPDYSLIEGINATLGMSETINLDTYFCLLMQFSIFLVVK